MHEIEAIRTAELWGGIECNTAGYFLYIITTFYAHVYIYIS